MTMWTTLGQVTRVIRWFNKCNFTRNHWKWTATLKPQSSWRKQMKASKIPRSVGKCHEHKKAPYIESKHWPIKVSTASSRSPQHFWDLGIFGIQTQWHLDTIKSLVQMAATKWMVLEVEPTTKWLPWLTFPHTLKILVFCRQLLPKQHFKKICSANQKLFWIKARFGHASFLESLGKNLGRCHQVP